MHQKPLTGPTQTPRLSVGEAQVLPEVASYFLPLWRGPVYECGREACAGGAKRLHNSSFRGPAPPARDAADPHIMKPRLGRQACNLLRAHISPPAIPCSMPSRRCNQGPGRARAPLTSRKQHQSGPPGGVHGPQKCTAGKNGLANSGHCPNRVRWDVFPGHATPRQWQRPGVLSQGIFDRSPSFGPHRQNL